MRLDDSLRQSVAAALGRFDAAPLPPGPRGAAAVALVLCEAGLGAQIPGLPVPASWSDAAAMVLTRRALDLRHHANQWALPGGRIEPGETAEQAALRELHEEVGLAPGPGVVLGRLDDFATRSGFTITPVVLWCAGRPQMVANPAEVASIHKIELTEFLRPDAPILDAPDGDGHPVLRMPVGHSWIAAPTAAFLYQFREVCLRGASTRVAHFEQPAFAWR